MSWSELSRATWIRRAPPLDVLLLAGLFAVSGTLHLIRPRGFEAIVPRLLPAKRTLVHLSGLLELGCASGLCVPASRRAAGLVSAGLLVAVFPANLQMASDVLRGESRVARFLVLARLPLQLPLLWIAVRAARLSGSAHRGP